MPQSKAVSFAEGTSAPAQIQIPRRSFWDPRGWSATGQMWLSVIIGAGVGVLVSTTAADNDRADLAFWLGFPGGLFLRALKALVIPLIFCSIVCSTVEMSTLGLAGTVGSSTFFCFMCTTALAVLTGIITCTAFKSLYSGQGDEPMEEHEINVALVCGGGGFDGSDGGGVTRVLTADGGDGSGSGSSRSVQCLPLSTEDEPSFLSDDADEIIARLSRNATFRLVDVNGVVQRSTTRSSIVAEEKSIPETVASALESIVTDNFTAATAKPDILATICFAVFFGFAVAKLDRFLDGGKNLVLIFCAQLNEIVTAMLALVLSLTPLAVASLIAGAIATVDDYSKLLHDVGTLMGSYFTTFAVQGR
jgi:Na+/H+-dicarboxylate symporter